MEFCPSCGTRLVITKIEKKGNIFPLLRCSKCDYAKLSSNAVLLKVMEHNELEGITVISEDKANIRTMPTLKIECPKCNNKEAYWWMVQTRGADESPTQFFRCSRCEYTWRETA